MDITALTLAGLHGGAVEELFQAALDKVLENLDDPNTDWKAKRAITLVCAFSTDAERCLGAVDVTVSTKLAGVKGLRALVHYGRHEGIRTAVESPRQEDLFPTPTGKPRPVPAAGEAS